MHSCLFKAAPVRGRGADEKDDINRRQLETRDVHRVHVLVRSCLCNSRRLASNVPVRVTVRVTVKVQPPFICRPESGDDSQDRHGPEAMTGSHRLRLSPCLVSNRSLVWRGQENIGGKRGKVRPVWRSFEKTKTKQKEFECLAQSLE